MNTRVLRIQPNEFLCPQGFQIYSNFERLLADNTQAATGIAMIGVFPQSVMSISGVSSAVIDLTRKAMSDDEYENI